MSDEADVERAAGTSDGNQLLRDLALGNAIQYHVRDVIRAAAATVRRLEPKSGPSGMRESQLRNVVNAAISAQSVEEVAAFILYQMGRSTNRGQWQYGKFGDQVVEDLLKGAVHTAALSAVRMAQARWGESEGEPDETLVRQAHIALARQYLGYLNRLFYFAEKSTERADAETTAGRWGELTVLSGEEATK